jgi:hypothetical protein
MNFIFNKVVSGIPFRKTCHQIALIAKFYHAKASRANKIIKEIFDVFELIKVKILFPNQKL